MDRHAVQVFVDDEPRLRVQRTGGVPGQLRGFLDRLDADMDEGVVLDGERIVAPDSGQRRRFVLHQLLSALAADRIDFARVLLTYLAVRWPELQAVYATRADDSWTVELRTR